MKLKTLLLSNTLAFSWPNLDDAFRVLGIVELLQNFGLEFAQDEIDRFSFDDN